MPGLNNAHYCNWYLAVCFVEQVGTVCVKVVLLIKKAVSLL